MASYYYYLHPVWGVLSAPCELIMMKVVLVSDKLMMTVGVRSEKGEDHRPY